MVSAANTSNKDRDARRAREDARRTSRKAAAAAQPRVRVGGARNVYDISNFENIFANISG